MVAKFQGFKVDLEIFETCETLKPENFNREEGKPVP
jgi:hypothetical protein